MIHTLLTGATGVSFFTGVALRFSRLDEYYRKRSMQNFKKRLQRLSASENKSEREQKEKQEIENNTRFMYPEIHSEEQFFI